MLESDLKMTTWSTNVTLLLVVEDKGFPRPVRTNPLARARRGGSTISIKVELSPMATKLHTVSSKTYGERSPNTPMVPLEPFPLHNSSTTTIEIPHPRFFTRQSMCLRAEKVIYEHEETKPFGRVPLIVALIVVYRREIMAQCETQE